MKLTKKQLAGMIDHTLLKPEAREEDIRKLCAEADAYGFASVCVNPCYVPLCAELLKHSPVRVCTVIGFPLGANAPDVKAFETRTAIRDGADEVDMVVNVGFVLSGRWDDVERDVRSVVGAAAPTKTLVKVILETCLLDEEQKILVCRIAQTAGADFVKTSTGFSTGGATPADVALLRRTVGPDMGVKAAGGIRTTRDALACVEAGASRLGCSAGIAVVEGLQDEDPA